jgi:hypothetical protein
MVMWCSARRRASRSRIMAAELHIRADLGVVDAAEKTLTTGPATPAPPPPSPVSQESAPPDNILGRT